MALERSDERPVRLHVMHDLGGGAAKWLRDFARADARATNLVLRSFSHGQAVGSGVALFASAFDETPLRAWRFARPIHGAAASHEEYRAILGDVVDRMGVDAILASSLIGHSLDALDTGLRSVVVAHDYFPYCPAIHLHFGGVCESCDGTRLERCHEGNPRFDPFPSFGSAERREVRERFVELVARPEVAMAVPSRSVAENLLRLDARFSKATFAHIPHGYAEPLAPLAAPEPSAHERLRIVVPGQLSAAKGVDLLRDALDEIARFADVYLVGCKELGELFRLHPAVRVVSRYEPGELAIHLRNINPHVGLLLSVVPETFSYALSELMVLGVPPVATRLGAFAERIRDGETGLLFEPDVASLVALLRRIDADRSSVARVRKALAGWAVRSAGDMVADYERLLGSERPARAGGPPRPYDVPPASSATDSATIADLWKEVKRLHLQLSMVEESRQREHADGVDMRAKLDEALSSIGRIDAELRQKQRQVENVSGLLHVRNLEIAELRASTSWKVSAPVRMAGRGLRKARHLAQIAGRLLQDRASLRANLAALGHAWRSGGFQGFKRSLVALQPSEDHQRAWARYRECFRREVRPRILSGIASLPRRPRISVVVPVYDTPEPMLREMAGSVLGQLYPDWELCLADDASSEPHVARILTQLAREDARIKVHLGRENRGVSHASNRALALATGEYVVLLDHDDVLEEQALFRVAQSILADEPDLIYSDEVLVSSDGAEVCRFALRPAFSLEYLRSHPYIVHLVAMRKSLVDSLGGFDEGLAISQDYDLVLRAVEKARRIVHVPEVLYRWRLHPESTGTRRKDEVMQASAGALTRHLSRCGEDGRVEPGSRFNLFEVRRPLAPGLRVAIVIPTKNHGDLLRQCIASLRATIREVPFDIVVVDHESDDPATRAYLDSIAGTVRIVPYRGAFNFSSINNRAVSGLEGVSHYLFCNNDIEALQPGWLERMLELAQQPSIGVVGAKLLYPDRISIQHAGVCVGAYGAAEHYAKRLRFPQDPIEPGYAEMLLVNHEVSAVTAACMLVRKDAFDAVGGFDEDIAVGFGDVDLCLRIAGRGYRIVFCPFAELVHHESYTRGTSSHDPHPADSARFRLKWRELLAAGDPHHHPGLSLESSNWALRQPLPCGFAIRRRIAERDGDGRTVLSFSAAAPARR